MKRQVWIIVLGLAAGIVEADIRDGLVGYYPLDEGSGETAYDMSGHGHDGTLHNGVTWIGDGAQNSAVSFDGTTDTRIELGAWNPAEGTGQLSLAMWIRWAGGGGTYQGLLGKRNEWPATTLFQFQVRPENGGTFRLETGTYAIVSPNGTLTPFVRTWVHVACTFDGTTGRLYLNGEEIASGSFAFTDAGEGSSMGIGCVTGGGPGHSGNGEVFLGDIDEVRIYNRILSEAEVLATMAGETGYQALDPRPGDSEMDVLRDTVLHWGASDYAMTHDVYFGTVFKDVNTADRANPRGVLLSQNQRDMTFDPPGRLALGQTYYWRIDEVNGAPDFTIYKGRTWSFTTERVSYPIETALATASSQSAPSMGPENTVNGSGLNAVDQHSVDAFAMWLSAQGDPAPWIQFEFDNVYKLHQMQVWNSNQAIEPFICLGTKDVSIETSTDNVTWISLKDAEFAQAIGMDTYAANTTIELDGVLARYVRVNVNTGYGPMGQYGLSEVRFFSIPIYASDPTPQDKETTEGIHVVLQWRPGREADRHEVILDRNRNDVANGSAAIGSTTDTSFDLAGQDIRYGETYYWAINEINDTDGSAYLSPVWCFTAPEFTVIDDFEQYNDLCDRIFIAWWDGLGYSDYLGEVTDEFCCEMLAYEGNGTGSIVGYAQAPFAEKTITHSGDQSMPFEYDNALPPYYSETETFIPGIDLTAGDADILSLYFRGRPVDADHPINTAESLYLVLNNQIVVHPDPAATQAADWTEWEIPLSAFDALTLRNVTKIYLGVGDRDNPQSGGTGMLYFDDIRVGRKFRPLGLVAYYPLEGNTSDASGNGHDGVAMGDPIYVTGRAGRGRGLEFNGLGGQYVDLGSLDPARTGQFSIALWARWNGVSAFWQGLIGKRDAWAANDMMWDLEHHLDGTSLYVHRHSFETIAMDPLEEGQWTHIAATYDGATVRLYRDGVLVSSGPFTMGPKTDAALVFGAVEANGGNPFNGALDEIRIYDTVLTAEAVLELAGQ